MSTPASGLGYRERSARPRSSTPRWRPRLNATWQVGRLVETAVLHSSPCCRGPKAGFVTAYPRRFATGRGAPAPDRRFSDRRGVALDGATRAICSKMGRSVCRRPRDRSWSIGKLPSATGAADGENGRENPPRGVAIARARLARRVQGPDEGAPGYLRRRTGAPRPWGSHEAVLPHLGREARRRSGGTRATRSGS